MCIIPLYQCPICFKEFNKRVTVCDCCGFEGISPPCFHKDENLDKLRRDELFAIYKFTKAVYYNKISFKNDSYEFIEDEKSIKVTGTFDRRGLVKIICAPDDKVSYADDGLLAFHPAVSLIIDVNNLSSFVLDESRASILFLGPNCKAIDKGYFFMASLRYLFVDEKNEFFSSDNNVLYDKDKRKLIHYSRLKPEDEFTVPKSVTVVGKNSFIAPKFLKRIFLPYGIKLEDGAIYSYDNQKIEIIYY
ncbi:MAG: hypothetical protein J6B29_02230 [Clostridia bacterium]|nr:hypothetical protein [Clostridia bacterium]